MRHAFLPAAGLLALALAGGCGPKPSPNPVILNADDEAKLNGPAAEPVENPLYTQWSRFPVGTTLTRTITTDTPLSEGNTVTTIAYTLTAKDDDAVVLETKSRTTTHGGRVQDNPPASTRYPRRVPLPDGIKREEWGKPKGEAVEEQLTVLGKTYKTRKSVSKGSTDAGELFQSVWSSDDMPGGLVRSVSKVPKVEETTTIEVTALDVPK